MGEAPQAIVLVESVEHADTLDFPPDAKLAYLTQTTLSVDDANRIIARLRARFPQIASPPKDDICYATQNRQEAIRTLAADADLVLVVGSQNSSNSQRLKEIAMELGVQSYLIDSAADIDDRWFAGAQTVVITAGASAPESVVRECTDYLRIHFGATVESRSLREEDVHFPLPRELRAIAN
jgi:4-hydroxy-3-methylbut-2-enyl diphosphate reductase